MAENQQNQEFKCTGDCYNCLIEDPVKRRNQWHYCAAQKAYNTMRMLGDMQAALRSMQGTVDELKAKIEAIQNSEVGVISPMDSELPAPVVEKPQNNIAQDGGGAPVDPRYS